MINHRKFNRGACLADYCDLLECDMLAEVHFTLARKVDVRLPWKGDSS